MGVHDREAGQGQPRAVDDVLTFNPANRSFVYQVNRVTQPKAADLGLTQSLVKPLLYFTGDKSGQPVYNPYAVLPLAHEADPAAMAELAPLLADYNASFATDGPEPTIKPPHGREYRPFQKGGIAYALKRRHSLIGDEMGLGKTVQAIGVANETQARRILVICPASVRLQWRAMVRDWLVPLNNEGGKVTTHVMTTGKHGVHPYARVVVVSYDLMRNLGIRSAVFACRWDLAILDESHSLKNHSAARTVASLGSYDGKKPGIQDHAERVVALTGTYLPNRPREAYTLARGLCWDAIDWMSEEAFEFRFNPSHTIVKIDQQTGQEKRIVIEKTGRLLELQARLRSQFMVRRAKADVLKDLPPKRYELLYVEDAAVRRAVEAERMLHFDIDAMQTDGKIDGHVAIVRHEMGIAMVPHAIAHLQNIMEELDKVVVFAHHRDVIAMLAEGLARYKPLTYVGGMSGRQKYDTIQEFIQRRDRRIFIGNMTAAGTGVDGLQKVCDVAVFPECSWVPGENDQCVDRIHRDGQGGSVLAQFLVAPGSLAEKIIARSIEKLQTTHVALDARIGV